MTTIRTKWHRLLELASGKDAYFTAPRMQMWEAEQPVAEHVSKYSTNMDTIRGFLEAVSNSPKFVVDSELLALSQNQDYHSSLLDMKRAGVFRLPYPMMIVEYAVGTTHYLCVMRDLHSFEERYFFEETLPDEFKHMPLYASLFRIVKDNGGEYLVLSPQVMFLDVIENTDFVRFRSKVLLDVKSSSLGALPPTKDLDTLCDRTLPKDSQAAGMALLAAMLLMNTEGVDREVIETEKLNRRRREGSTPIPRHTYIRIGRVYRSKGSDVSDEFNPRKSPRPHWRRGHNRRIRTGEGRQAFYWRYFPPRLVAYNPIDDGSEPPTAHEYRMKR